MCQEIISRFVRLKVIWEGAVWLPATDTVTGAAFSQSAALPVIATMANMPLGSAMVLMLS